MPARRMYSVDATNQSLLRRVRNPKDSGAWREFVGLYRPILVYYARVRRLTPADAEDVAQASLKVLVDRMPRFEYCRQKGRFSNWLRGIAENQIRKLLSQRRMSQANTSVLRHVRQTEDSELALWERIWLRDHFRYCLAAIQGEFAATTFEAFERSVLNEWPVNKVCATLKMNRNQVYLAKSRVLRRLREKMTDLIGYEV